MSLLLGKNVFDSVVSYPVPSVLCDDTIAVMGLWTLRVFQLPLHKVLSPTSTLYVELRLSLQVWYGIEADTDNNEKGLKQIKVTFLEKQNLRNISFLNIKSLLNNVLTSSKATKNGETVFLFPGSPHHPFTSN